MNRLSTEKRAAIVGCLVEGNSIRATVRITGAAKNTVTRLLVDLGAACAEYQDATLRGLPYRTIECDEIWAFCYAKRRTSRSSSRARRGLRRRVDLGGAVRGHEARAGVAGRRAHDRGRDRVHVRPARPARRRARADHDGRAARLPREAVGDAFETVDFAQLHKVYGVDPRLRGAERRYSPPVCTSTQVTVVAGDPDPGEISTSYVERQNLTMRMGMRRFTRLTNGFSKKVENLAHAVSLHYMHYNFGRVHQTLRCAPAQAASVTDRRWSLRDIAALLD